MQSERAKSQIVYEQLQYVKTIVLGELKKYFPLMHFSCKENVLGVNVFETNIKKTIDRLDSSSYEALGINDRYGFNFSDAERLYISTSTMNYWDSYKTDMIFVYNPELMDDYKMYGNAHNKALVRLTQDFMADLYKIIILKGLGIRYLNLISKYRNIVNENKPYRRNHKHLLKIKYELSKDFYEFKKIDEELPVDGELSRVERILKDDSYISSSVYHGFHTAELFYGNPGRTWKQIKINYNEVENDLNRKIDISDSLTNYHAEIINRVMISIQVILAILTFCILIYPDVAKEIVEFINELFS